ncbi:MAG: oligosaccharide flippase family protein, partial [Fidelibacterota bacterium]
MQSQAHRIFRNSIFLFGGRTIDKIVAFIFAIVIARYLGFPQLGKYSLAISYVGLFFVLSNLGLDFFIIREVAIDNKKAGVYLGSSLLLKLFLSTLTISLLIAIVYMLPYPEDTKLIIYIASSFLLLDSLNRSLGGIFTSFERMGLEALSLIIEKLVSLLVMIALLLKGLS